jgi:hypothetical protein
MKSKSSIPQLTPRQKAQVLGEPELPLELINAETVLLRDMQLPYFRPVLEIILSQARTIMRLKNQLARLKKNASLSPKTSRARPS